MVAEDSTCVTIFGGDPEECAPIVRRLTDLFSARSEGYFETICATLPMDIAVAKDTDEAWRDRSSWVWTRTPLFSNEFTRVFACRGVH